MIVCPSNCNKYQSGSVPLISFNKKFQSEQISNPNPYLFLEPKKKKKLCKYAITVNPKKQRKKEKQEQEPNSTSFYNSQPT